LRFPERAVVRVSGRGLEREKLVARQIFAPPNVSPFGRVHSLRPFVEQRKRARAADRHIRAPLPRKLCAATGMEIKARD